MQRMKRKGNKKKEEQKRNRDIAKFKNKKLVLY